MFPWWLSGKISAYNAGDAGDVGSVPGLGRFPWRMVWQPAPVFLLGKSHGQRSLTGYSPWGHKDSDTTEATENTLLQSNHYRLSLQCELFSQRGEQQEDRISPSRQCLW